MTRVYIARFDSGGGDSPTFFAVPVVNDSIRGEVYRRDPNIMAFFLANGQPYGFYDINDCLRVRAQRGDRMDNKIEIGDNLFIAKRFIGKVEKIIEVPEHE